MYVPLADGLEMLKTADNTAESFVPGALTSALKMLCHLYSYLIHGYSKAKLYCVT
jgi:hypothetical protein